MDTLFIGHNILSFSTLDSTNDYSWELLSKKRYIEGTIVLAQFQRKGKGQRGKKWSCNRGEGLLFSIILHPKELIINQYYLNKAVALGVCEGINQLGVCSKIKWPNDIYVNNKKIAGILIENSVSGQLINNSVVGIGVNINQTAFKETIINPVSLKELLNKDYELTDILEILCSSIEKRYLQFKSASFEVIDLDYHKLLYKYNQKSTFRRKNVLFQADIKSVTSEGKIQLIQEGFSSFYNAGEVEFVI